MLEITNMTTVRNFEVMSKKNGVMEI